jgi:trans-aconitate 2-methyltransferase
VGPEGPEPLNVNGDERAIDAGCGSGRLTGDLMERLPNGRLIAIDRSWNMLLTARANLRPVLGSRVSFVQVSLPDLPFAGWADLVFSTATFHWVKIISALRGHLQDLAIGRRLHAQCGGGPNLRPCPRARRRGHAQQLRSIDSLATGRALGIRER